jgi:hypothetical protein
MQRRTKGNGGKPRMDLDRVDRSVVRQFHQHFKNTFSTIFFAPKKNTAKLQVQKTACKFNPKS